ncbi:MAG: thioredoxin domain-containing protein [Acidimicrobiales bacterium]
MANRLSGETSPYLRQHEDNPVDWWPWGPEAFAEAKARDVPVLISVGYSACHWCHVMAHESFENTDIAAAMNESFVSIKVDREERPDVDAVYMEATQAMTGSGGWPMTVFADQDGQPFFAGTYFPPQSAHGRPGFPDILSAVAEAWTERRSEIAEQASALADAVRARTALAPDPDATVGTHLLHAAYDRLRNAFDPEWGGFGGAPKFPQASFIELLFRAHARNRAGETKGMITSTLDGMASGGIYDHLGGGFARYSVDARWLVPHFEKVLYDQAQLLRAYTRGFQITGDERYRQVATETVTYVLRDLALKAGGIASAEDADSEGEEGKFYVWTTAEITAILGPSAANEAIAWWGVTDAGNFEGNNILHRPKGAPLARPEPIEQARQALFDAREKRIRPGLDDKVLTEWNAMWIAALAEAGAALGEDSWIATAAANAEFLLRALRSDDGRWMRSWQGDQARHLAYAVDYAWLVEAFTRLSEATGEARWLAEAVGAADALIELFWDHVDGGLFTTGDDGERLIARAKDYYDGATPSANGVAALALARLGALTGGSRWSEHAGAILDWAAGPLGETPQAFTYMLGAVDFLDPGPTELAVVGDRPDLVRAIHERYLPSAVLAWGEPTDSPLWTDRSSGAAYVCRDFVCQAPATTIDELVAQLGVHREA